MPDEILNPMGEFEYIETLEFYDVPLVVAWRTVDKKIYVSTVLSCVGNIERAMFVRVTRERMVELITGKVDLRRTILEAEGGVAFLVEREFKHFEKLAEFRCMKFEPVASADIPEEYLPDKGYSVNDMWDTSDTIVSIIGDDNWLDDQWHYIGANSDGVMPAFSSQMGVIIAVVSPDGKTSTWQSGYDSSEDLVDGYCYGGFYVGDEITLYFNSRNNYTNELGTLYAWRYMVKPPSVNKPTGKEEECRAS